MKREIDIETDKPECHWDLARALQPFPRREEGIRTEVHAGSWHRLLLFVGKNLKTVFSDLL